jgi:hypothetical protein
MKKLALTLLIGSFALVGASACSPAAAPAMVASAEGEALAAMGVDPADIVPGEQITDPTSPSAAPKDRGNKGDGKRLEAWARRHPAKVFLARNVLHGEAVVQTKEGNITVAVQRGEVTAISADSITVKSADGVTWTWKFDPKLRVVENRATIQPSAVKTGAKVALAGPKTGDQLMARLIVIPLAK